MNLISLCLCAAYAPLVGVTRRNSRTLHAVTLEAIGARAKDWPNVQRYQAACGKRVTLVHPAPIGWWAPRIRGTRLQRCPACVELHGTRTRPGPRWLRKAEAAT